MCVLKLNFENLEMSLFKNKDKDKARSWRWVRIYWGSCKFQLRVHESTTWRPVPREHPGLDGEHLEDSQTISNSNGLAGLSFIFLEALKEKAVPMPKASDQ